MTSSVNAAAPVSNHPRSRGVVAGGLGVGATLGFTGNFVAPGSVQDLLYGVSAVGLILGASLLAVSHLSAGRHLGGAGFLMLALGETRVLNPTHVPGGEESLAAGMLLYAPALLLVAASGWGPRWVRALGAAAAVPFAAHGLLVFGGGAVDTAGPLASIGYTLLTLTVVGWIVTVLRSPDQA